MSAGAKSVKKQQYFAKLERLVRQYSQILVVEANHVGSKQMAEVRFALRDKAVVLMGKNTMIRTALRQHVEEIPQLEALIPLIKENIGLIFCGLDAAEIRKVVLQHRVPAPARQGVIAPLSVTIPAGPTGMDPGQTSFFQALQIATKIVKGQIEIQSPVEIIKEGDKVTASQAVLLTKLDIKPFSYALKPTIIYDNGSQYPASVLDIDPTTLMTRVQQAITTVAAFSLGASVPTKASVPHSIITAFKQCVAIALEADHIFPQMKALKEALDNPDAFAAPVAAGAAETKPKEEEKPAEEEEEEEDDDMGFGLFD